MVDLFAHSKVTFSAQFCEHQDETICFLPIRNLLCTEEQGIHKQTRGDAILQVGSWKVPLTAVEPQATPGLYFSETAACVRCLFVTVPCCVE